MAINPMKAMKLKDRYKIFNQQHPKIAPFFSAIHKKGLTPGAVVEMKITTTDGKEYVTNIKLTPEDIETIQMALELRH